MTQKQLWQYALRLLARKKYSTKEMHDKLNKKCLSSTDIVSVIDKLQEYTYLDDRDYAESYIYTKSHTTRPISTRSLAYLLMQKGIAQDIIDQELQSCEDKDLIKKALHYKLNTTAYSKLTAEEQRKKIVPFLASKGFSWQDIKEAIEENMQ